MKKGARIPSLVLGLCFRLAILSAIFLCESCTKTDSMGSGGDGICQKLHTSQAKEVQSAIIKIIASDEKQPKCIDDLYAIQTEFKDGETKNLAKAATLILDPSGSKAKDDTSILDELFEFDNIVLAFIRLTVHEEAKVRAAALEALGFFIAVTPAWGTQSEGGFAQTTIKDSKGLEQGTLTCIRALEGDPVLEVRQSAAMALLAIATASSQRSEKSTLFAIQKIVSTRAQDPDPLTRGFAKLTLGSEDQNDPDREMAWNLYKSKVKELK
jgi:hypothetical protein